MANEVEGLVKASEKIENSERKFGSITHYYPAFLELKDGTKMPLLFTRNQLSVAMQRARQNREEDLVEPKSFLEHLLG